MAQVQVHHVVIVGGSCAGISEAHYLLRHILPAAAKYGGFDFMLTLVSASTQFYWKVGSPRCIVKPSMISIADSLISIEDGFNSYYDAARFRFVHATAVGLKESSKLLVVKNAEEETFEIKYDSLVIATGTNSNSPLFSLKGPHENTQKALEDVQRRLPKATSILVGGGGPAGVETSGELGSEYGGKKEITLLSGGKRLLSNLNTKTAAEAASRLSDLGVHIIHNVKIISAAPTTDGKTYVHLSNDTEMVVDIYIDATGGHPNTHFLPRSWLTPSGLVKTESATLRLAVPKLTHVYAFGSCSSASNGSYLDILWGARPLGDSIRIDLLTPIGESRVIGIGDKKDAVIYDSWWAWLTGQPTDPFKRRYTFTPMTKETQFVPVGRDGGVGIIFGWRIPSWMVWKLKGKTFMIEMAQPMVLGNNYIKA